MAIIMQEMLGSYLAFNDRVFAPLDRHLGVHTKSPSHAVLAIAPSLEIPLLLLVLFSRDVASFPSRLDTLMTAGSFLAFLLLTGHALFSFANLADMVREAKVPPSFPLYVMEFGSQGVATSLVIINFVVTLHDILVEGRSAPVFCWLSTALALLWVLTLGAHIYVGSKLAREEQKSCFLKSLGHEILA